MKRLAVSLLLILLAGCSYADVPPHQTSADAVQARGYVGCRVLTHAPVPEGPCIATHPPFALEKVPYIYPDIAREAGVDGTVIVHACVCEHGRVIQTHARSIPMLDAAAMDAVSRWTFQPASTDGKDVPCWIDVPVRFSLR